MNILKNKHMVLAMFVAPVLAIIAYFATDYVVSEKPHAARQGTSYKLAAKSNCRYQSGQCTLHNGDVEVNVRAERITGSLIELSLLANMPLQNALVSSVIADKETDPVVMQPAVSEENTWRAKFDIVDAEKSTLRFVLELSGLLFYAETPAVFIDYDTSFSRDNFSD
jgi:hypothetical protein